MEGAVLKNTAKQRAHNFLKDVRADEMFWGTGKST